jgi:hypothetical protein
VKRFWFRTLTFSFLLPTFVAFILRTRLLLSIVLTKRYRERYKSHGTRFREVGGCVMVFIFYFILSYRFSFANKAPFTLIQTMFEFRDEHGLRWTNRVTAFCSLLQRSFTGQWQHAAGWRCWLDSDAGSAGRRA